MNATNMWRDTGNGLTEIGHISCGDGMELHWGRLSFNEEGEAMKEWELTPTEVDDLDCGYDDRDDQTFYTPTCVLLVAHAAQKKLVEHLLRIGVPSIDGDSSLKRPKMYWIIKGTYWQELLDYYEVK